jgi:hypothetical protein
MSASDAPDLVIDTRARAHHARHIFGAIALAGLTLFYLFLSPKHVAALSLGLLDDQRTIFAAEFGGLLWIGLFAFMARDISLAGTFRFYERHIEIRHGNAPPDLILFRDLIGYRDASNDFVKLVYPTLPRLRFTRIPTPTESDRTALLALLDAHGLKRLD